MSPFTVTANVAVVAPAAIVRRAAGGDVVAPRGGRAVGRGPSTVTVCPLAAESVTVKVAVVVPALPSVTVTSSIDRVGGASSSVMVPAPEPSAIVALAGLVRLTDEGLVGLVDQVAVDR